MPPADAAIHTYTIAAAAFRRRDAALASAICLMRYMLMLLITRCFVAARYAYEYTYSRIERRASA